MKQRVFENYIDRYVKDSLRKSDGTARGALQWLRSNQSALKTVLLTSNPTEKTEAEMAVIRHFQSLSMRTGSSKSGSKLEPGEVVTHILQEWHETKFGVAVSMAKGLRGVGKNPIRYIKEASEHLSKLRKLGHPHIDYLQHQFKELDG